MIVASMILLTIIIISINISIIIWMTLRMIFVDRLMITTSLSSRVVLIAARGSRALRSWPNEVRGPAAGVGWKRRRG